MLTLKSLAERFSLEFKGDADTIIHSIGTLANAMPGQLAFLANSKYTQQLIDTRASVVILSEQDIESCPCACLISKNPYTSYALISSLFESAEQIQPGVHATAIIHANANVSAEAHIGAYVVIGENSVIAAHACIHPHCTIGMDCVVGEASVLMANVTFAISAVSSAAR